MKIEQWLDHIEKSTGAMAPSRGGDREAWKSIVQSHVKDNPKCTHCAARRKAKKAATYRAYKRAEDEAARATGLTKVRGPVSGKVYYESLTEEVIDLCEKKNTKLEIEQELESKGWKRHPKLKKSYTHKDYPIDYMNVTSRGLTHSNTDKGAVGVDASKAVDYINKFHG
jgi:hypothetical protein